MRGGAGGLAGLNEQYKETGPHNFAQYYMTKYAKSINVMDAVFTPIGEIPSNSILMIIDMQNDFIDSPVDGLRGPNKTGNFSVTDGNSCVQGIINFVNNNDKFEKIIVTRDWHSPAHCSFGLSTTAGYAGKYPHHCEYNSVGADLAPELKNQIKKTETGETASFTWNNTSIPIDIVFKGHHSDADSYGAADYQEDEYLPKRQNENMGNESVINSACCVGGKCSAHTGASILKPEYMNKSNEKIVFFKDIDTINNMITELKKENGAPIIKPIYDVIQADNDLSNRLSNTYFNKYDYGDINGKNVYIVGLAGEFCVKDTAINLKRKYPEAKIFVVQDLTRYVFLPTWIGLQRYKLTDESAKTQGMSVYEPEIYPSGDWNKKSGNGPNDFVFSNEPNKSLSYYVFNNNSYKTYTRETLDNNKKDVYFAYNPDNPYFHFASDHRPLIKDYAATGIKLAYLPGGDVEKIINTFNNNTITKPQVPTEA